MSPKKNLSSVTPGTGLFATTKPITIGTELTEARLARTVRRGELGTTTVKSSVHTATHESPTHCASKSSALGFRNSAAAMPKLLTTSKPSPMTIITRRGMRGLLVTAATTQATAIEIAPGPHWAKLEKTCARASENIRSRKKAAMKKMNA